MFPEWAMSVAVNEPIKHSEWNLFEEDDSKLIHLNVEYVISIYTSDYHMLIEGAF